MRWEQKVQYASITDIGFRRRNNQDSIAVQICKDGEAWSRHGHLFVVADGMGGHAVGELASKIAVDTIPHTFFKSRDTPVVDALKEAIEVANSAIFARGSMNRDFERMGTTCTALALSPEGAIIGHVGDSRAYRIRDRRIDQLTFDHSLQWELIRRGQMNPEEVFLHEPRHVITRSLGPEETVNVDVEGPYPVLPGDVFLLCSDGLTGHVEDSEIGMIAGELEAGDACRLLVNLANLRGGSDNISVIVARVGDLPGAVAELPESDQAANPAGLSSRWLMGFWIVALLFVAGVSLSLLGSTGIGLPLAFVSLTGLFAMLWRLWSRYPRRRGGSGSADTLLWRPYRTASAEFSRTFFNQLAALESELQQTAVEEQWNFDQQRYDALYRRAKQLLAEGKTVEAFTPYAQAIDVLMAGLHQQRRQMRQDYQRKRPLRVEKNTSDHPGG